FHQAMDTFDEIVRIAIGQEQIQNAVVVIVKELQAPAAHEPCRPTDSSRSGLIIVRLIMVVLVNRKTLHVDVGDKQIHPSVLIKVGGIKAHTGAGSSVGAVGNAGESPGFLKPSLSAIHKYEIRQRVIANEEIHLTVIVEVGSNYSPCLAKGVGDAGSLADIGKCSIAVVVKEPTWHGVIEPWN